MKKILFLMIMALGCLIVFSGCATDGIYGVAKSGVVLTKAVVKVTDTEVSDNVKDAYSVAKDYDSLRTAVRKEIKKKPLHVDINSTVIN